MWIIVTLHSRVSKSLISKLLRGEGTAQEPRERVMPAAWRESMTVGETLPAGGDLTGMGPAPPSLSSIQSTSRASHWQNSARNQEPREPSDVVCMHQPILAESKV